MLGLISAVEFFPELVHDTTDNIESAMLPEALNIVFLSMLTYYKEVPNKDSNPIRN
jgi:hypothetical protein